MSYRYDSYLVIANTLGSASGDAKAMLFETYDKLRDLTVSGSGQGTGFEMTSGFLYNLASLFSPSMYGTVFGASESMSVPGTSYYNNMNTGSSYGLNSLYNYSGFPSGAAGLGMNGWATGGAANIFGWGSSGMSGTPTGFASNVGGIADVASAAAWGLGGSTGYGWAGKNIVMPLAGVISGWGGIMQAAAPYLGAYGLPATVMANLMQGTSSAALAAYQNITGNITANADVILSNKVRNIETVCKMLDTQGDVVKKMLKEEIDGDSKAIQNL